MGLKEQLVFPEINYDRVDKIRGMDIAFATTAKTDEEARVLLEGFNFPLPQIVQRQRFTMAKTSSVEKNNRRRKMAKKFEAKRDVLKTTIMNRELPIEERFTAQLTLAALPRNSAKNRIRNRCDLTGRSRGNYRKFRLSRIALRELGNFGMIPGLVKSSW